METGTIDAVVDLLIVLVLWHSLEGGSKVFAKGVSRRTIFLFSFKVILSVDKVLVNREAHVAYK